MGSDSSPSNAPMVPTSHVDVMPPCDVFREDAPAARQALAHALNSVVAVIGGEKPAAKALGVDKSVIRAARIGARISRGSTRLLRDALALRNPTTTNEGQADR